MSEFETGISFAEYVSVEVLKDDQKIKLSVNPVGQFNPGGCTAFVSVKKDGVLALEKVEDLYEYLLKRIGFDNLEAVVDLDDYSLKGVLEYTKDLEVDDENEWWLNYFKRLEKKVDEFHEALISMNAQLKDLKVKVHQYHEASGELCDFVDFICCPEGEDEEALREFFEENLSKDSEIDNIMECFEDGYFYGDSFSADETTLIDFASGNVEKTMTITDVR